MVSTKAALWRVEVSIPPGAPESAQWTRNVMLSVLATTAERALACVREAEPTCTVHAVHKISSRLAPLLIDGEAVAEMGLERDA